MIIRFLSIFLKPKKNRGWPAIVKDFLENAAVYPLLNKDNPDAKRQYAFDYVTYLAFYGGDHGVQPNYKEYSVYTNMKSSVRSYGGNLSLKTKILREYTLGVSYDFMNYEFEDKDNGLFEPNFNTPKHSVKLHLSNANLFRNLGFGIDAKWSDKYRWVSQFVKADIPSRVVVDAQLSYALPSLKSSIKLGGTNLFGKAYDIAPGVGSIGNTYYLSWVIQN